jgi:hypothetical protein
MKTAENMEEDPDDPEPVGRDTQIEYFDQLYSASMGQ